MFASWGLPDYLAHLQSILPSDVPPPLQIRGSTSFIRDDLGETISGSVTVTTLADGANTGSGQRGSMGPPGSEIADTQSTQMANVLANATESVTERGVKVKWPAKRMSVADMNKRVRALVEWVGREQAIALDRERRKLALEKALQANLESTNSALATPAVEKMDLTHTIFEEPASMAVDTPPDANSLKQEQNNETELVQSETAKYLMNLSPNGPTNVRPSTSKMMEELMEELICFQERFGPGVKGQARDRRVAVIS